MRKQNADPHLTSLILDADFDHLDQALTLRLFREVRENRCRISALERKLDAINEELKKFSNRDEQIEECKNLILNRLRYLDAEIEELQGLVNIYCPPE
ncbi:hypothetical protein [Anabaena azotica]|uniref:Uncharacterized protein n=1 Tax=Anabaena azotica FACHB-119 TaxID=947527 RepID=A0ABR8DA28_9NOST|nr:hypothetical protein [Anabaena azotica]MBD2503791.1 hypothetical protein [Anabaena azotica FACHB-119]